MINLDDIKGFSVINLLKEYSGINPYIKKMRNEYLKNNKVNLTETQIKYIEENHNREPILLNKIVNISLFLGEELKKQEDLSFTPERILIEYMLAENEKSYHVYGKLTRKQEKSKMYWLPKTQVLDDPFFEEKEIEVDFSKYNAILSKYGKQLYKHQEEGVKFLLSRNGCILADGMGLGKGLVTNTLVITPKGKVKIGDLKIGDKIIGSNGKKCNVIGVYPQGIKDTYKITFNDGYSIITDNSHLWSVSSNSFGENTKNTRNRYITLSTEQMLDENLVLEIKGIGHNINKTYKFKTYYKEKNGNNKWQIPIVNPIEFENNDKLPIEPYLLGLALGDGHFNRSNSIVFQLYKNDFEELFNNIKINEHKPRINNRTAYIGYYKNEIKELGLSNIKSYNKFIPEIYKYSNIENRLAILQGLMDTDGHCMKSKNNKFNGTEYTTVSERLADDVAEIVHSLGGIVRKKNKISSYKKNDGTKVICRTSYRLNIKMPEQFNPFRLKRKAEQYNPPKKYKTRRYIKNIEPVGKAETICIAVDAPDKLYVTEHAIVTHNTTQSIVAALESGDKNILIVCPSSLKINWKREINIFCDDVAVISGRKYEKARFTIINYDILKNFHTLGNGKKKNHTDPVLDYNRELVNSNFDLIIIDEAHYLKNKDSIRTEIIHDLVKISNIKKVWLLTGTPISNRPMDFYSLLKLIKAKIVDNWEFFAIRYCNARKMFRTLKNGQKKRVWITDGSSNLEELANKTKHLIIRRLKEDVLDMPDKVIIPMHYELSDKDWEEYDALWDEYLKKRNNENKENFVQRDLVELILLRKFIALKAIPHTIEIAENALETNKKIIIFTNFTDELNELASHFGKICVIHNGPMNEKEKQRSVDEFQNNPNIKIFIGNIKSAGVGITLTEANVVIFNSFDWVPGSNEQGEDRCHRIGQKNNVVIYYQLFENTISTRMWETLKNKKDIINTIIGDKQFSEDEIINIITQNFLNE